ncbi:MAG: RNase H family protein [Aureliella sp.]
MVVAKPHFLLFCDAHASAGSPTETAAAGGRWHFVLERIDAAERLEAADAERAVPRERLALLAVVRGLEALEQPSQVTLVTTSRYVSRGLRYGLSEWREADYSWEHFGVQKPIRNADLWQRIDCALRYHEVACRLLESSWAPAQATVHDDTLEGIDAPLPVPSLAASTANAESAVGGDIAQQIRGRSRREVASSRRKLSRPSVPGGGAWWQLTAGWRQWWRGRAVRPSLLAGV